jgi:hypothetical protein
VAGEWGGGRGGDFCFVVPQHIIKPTCSSRSSSTGTKLGKGIVPFKKNHFIK